MKFIPNFCSLSHFRSMGYSQIHFHYVLTIKCLQLKMLRHEKKITRIYSILTFQKLLNLCTTKIGLQLKKFSFQPFTKANTGRKREIQNKHKKLYEILKIISSV